MCFTVISKSNLRAKCILCKLLLLILYQSHYNFLGVSDYNHNIGLCMLYKIVAMKYRKHCESARKRKGSKALVMIAKAGLSMTREWEAVLLHLFDESVDNAS